MSPTASGSLDVYPTGTSPTATGTLNFRAGRTRANNSFLTLGAGGEVSVRTTLSGAGTVHFVLDVSGYYR